MQEVRVCLWLHFLVFSSSFLVCLFALDVVTLAVHVVVIPDQWKYWGIGFDVCAEGFILLHASLTVLPAGSHLIMIQWGSCSRPFCSNKCAILITRCFQSFAFFLHSLEAVWHAADSSYMLNKPSYICTYKYTTLLLFHSYL